jgi:hypothetical protein
MATLKTKCDASQTLGIVPVPNGELLCIYDGELHSTVRFEL